MSSISETYQVVLTATPPADMPHDTRAAEIRELTEWLAVKTVRDAGTDFIVVDANMRDAPGNAGRMYVEKDVTTNAILGFYSKVGGEWKRWDFTDREDCLYVDVGGKLRVYRDSSLFLGPEDTTVGSATLGKRPLATHRPGYGLTTNTRSDISYLDLLPDGGVAVDPPTEGGSIELYNSTPTETDPTKRILKLRVKAGGITPTELTPNRLFLVHPASTPITSAEGDSLVKLLWATPVAWGGSYGVDVNGIAVPETGWYQVHLALTVVLNEAVFDGGAANLELAFEGTSGDWFTCARVVDGSLTHSLCLSGIVRLLKTAQFAPVYRVDTALTGGSIDVSAIAINSTLSMQYLGEAEA